MSPTYVEPSIDSVSFNCPHCGAHAQQTWAKAYAHSEDGEPPRRVDPGVIDHVASDKELHPESKLNITTYFERLLRGEVFVEESDKTLYKAPTIENVFLSYCYSCKRHAVWIHDHLVYPSVPAAGFSPNEDLSDDIRRDFREAATILDASPRGAAALLRLSIQKLCVHLNEPGKNLNADIASLVKRGLDPHVQQALDIVRVVGNNAVHPGELYIGDDRVTATSLFALVNEIAEDLISKPARVKALYEKVVPETARAAIARRDESKP
jgi:hypothetical protein